MNVLTQTWTGWGTGILETDRAMDATAGYLSQELDINIHFAGDPRHYHPDDPECTDPDCAHEPKARSIERTREYLDKGNLTRVFNKYKKQGGAIIDQKMCLNAREMCVILAVKAMEFGAKLSESQRSTLRAMYKGAGLSREGIWQFGIALDEYVNGTPYELKEPDRTDHNIYIRFESARYKALGGRPDDLSYPTARYFEDGIPTPDPLDAKVLAKRREKGEPRWFPNSPVIRECGACLKKLHELPDGLHACSSCKKIMYCGKECQRSHWKAHKKHCAAFAAAPDPPAIDTLPKSPMLIKGFDPLSGGDPLAEMGIKSELKTCTVM